MNMFRYSDILNRSIFISDILEFKIPDDSVIRGIIDNDSKYPIISIINELHIIKLSSVETYNILDIYIYYKNLVSAICRSINKTCSDNVLDILAAYAFPEITVSIDNISEVSALFEKFIDIDLNYDDELWYMQETVRYKLLNLYTQHDVVCNIDKIRSLLSVVKTNKEKYDSITATIESIK